MLWQLLAGARIEIAPCRSIVQLEGMCCSLSPSEIIPAPFFWNCLLLLLIDLYDCDCCRSYVWGFNLKYWKSKGLTTYQLIRRVQREITPVQPNGVDGHLEWECGLRVVILMLCPSKTK
jgi:hypothetical protein